MRLTSQTARQSRRALPSASMATGRKTQVAAPSDTGSGSLRWASPPGTPTHTSRSVRSVSPWRPHSVSVVSARSTSPEARCRRTIFESSHTRLTRTRGCARAKRRRIDGTKLAMMSSGTPNRTSPSNWAVRIDASSSSLAATSRRACASSRSPAGASASPRPWRSNSRHSSISSSRLICWLAAAWLMCSADAACVTPPRSTTDRNVRNRSIIMFSERTDQKHSIFLYLAEAHAASMKSIPAGLWLPLITPFKDNAVDYESYRRLIDHYLALGVDALFPLGTTGEAPALDDAEVERVIDVTLERAGPLPVFVGVGGNATHKVVRTLRRLERLPFAGIVSVCPYYNRPSQDGLIAHFKAIAAATDRQVLIYNIPYRTAVNLSNDSMLELAQVPNIVGCKDSSGSIAQSLDLLQRSSANFAVLTG